MPAPITLLNKGNLVPQMGEKQEDLDKLVPLQYIMDWIGTKLQSKTANSMSDRVVILKARTGSGKSSSIPTGIYLHHFNKYRANVICTEPRVLTTIDIPRDISLIESYKTPNKNGLSIELYRNMGYQTQEYTQKPKERGVLFCTTGILLQLLKTLPDDKFCKRYKFVIIDEAHDRSLDVDLILLLMKRLIKRTMAKNPPFLILMSATLNIEQYCEYFNTKTVFDVRGQSKPIETIYPEVDVPDIYAKSCEIVAGLDEYEKKHPSEDIKHGIRDVIIFMPSTGPIKRMIGALESLNKTLTNKILPISITSADINGGTDSYRLIMEDYRKLNAYRRVIVSTNVAETGLTLETLKYCIDTAYQFTSEFDPKYGINIMITKPTTSSMSLQRKGRVGRKYPGIFFPLFTEKTFESMIVDNTPSVLVDDMTSHMLALFASEDVSSMDKLPVYDMLDPPMDDGINYSLEKLFSLGAIDAHSTITPLGKMMNAFRKLPVEACKMILTGLAYKDVSIKELVCLAILMTTRKSEILLDYKISGVDPYETAGLLDELYQITPTFDRAKCDTLNYNRLKAKLLVGCEMLELLLIYQRFTAKAATLSAGELMKWSMGKGINYTTMCNITESIDEVYWLMLDQLKINPVRDSSEHMELYQVLKRSGDINNTELVDAVIALKKCIYEGYKNNILVWDQGLLSYKTRHGLRVMVPSKLVSRISYQKLGARIEQEYPQILLYKELLTRTDRNGRFTHEASVISIMDGFVDVDTEFLQS